MARFTMRCPQCGACYPRKGWFTPQWHAESPIVLGTPSGDYDRCKACYAGNIAVVPVAVGVDRKWDDQSKDLCRLVIAQSQRCRTLNLFMEFWVERGMHKRVDLLDHGAIDCVTESDPKQYLYGQRWTFDPMNWNYQKAFHLSWPDQVRGMNRITLGNILESMLGTRNGAERNGWRNVSQRGVIVSVCTNISHYVDAMYQLTAYTDTVHDDVEEWARYVTHRALAPAPP